MRLNMHKLKNKFKRLIMSAATIGTACLLAGCGAGAAAGTDNSSVTESQSGVNGSEQENASSDSQKLQIVATIFPEYTWVKEILGDQAENVDLTLLLGNGTDMHSFQPTMEDILKVSTCDLFIYVGGESDSWVADALKGAGNPDRKAINLMDVLGDQVKEVKASARLKSHPVCLTAGEGLSFEMEKYFQAVQPDSAIRAERILELNVEHPAFQALEAAVTADPEKAKKYATLLYDQALLIAGLPLEDPSGYTDLVCELMK